MRCRKVAKWTAPLLLGLAELVSGRFVAASSSMEQSRAVRCALARASWKRCRSSACCSGRPGSEALREAKQRGWTKTPNGSEWWKNCDLWHVKVSWCLMIMTLQSAISCAWIKEHPKKVTYRKFFLSVVHERYESARLCGAHHLIRSEPPASGEQKMRLMLCTKGLFQLQNFWFLRGWFGGLPDDETSTGDWSIIETKGAASESEFYVDFPGIVKFESEDFEIQKSQKQSIAHNSCHCWLFGPLKIQHVVLEIENKVLEVSATNSGVLENVFGKAHGTHFVRLKTCPLSIPYGRHLPSLTTRPGIMVASASRKTSLACWKKNMVFVGKKNIKKNKTWYMWRFPTTGFPSHSPQYIADQWEKPRCCDLPPLPPRRPRYPKRCPGAWCAPHGGWDLEKSQRNFQRKQRFWCRAARWSPGILEWFNGIL